MQRSLLPLLSVLLFASVPVSFSAAHSGAAASTMEVGGPPSVRLAEKAKGNVTRAEWTAAAAVKLAGCVTDARVTSMTLCINDCKGKQAALTTANGTLSKEMKSMIANLPDGTPFTVKVEVKDGSGKFWEVPDAAFTIVR